MKRKAISKKLRFDVFKRDAFTCQYCGSHPPGTILHVDHIDPVANGGGNDIDNLITACIQCNLGKGARSLSAVPQTLKDKASQIKEAEEQLRGYHAVIESQRERIEQDAWQVADALKRGASENGFNKADFLSIKQFIQKIGLHECLDAAEVADARFPYSYNRSFKYFCGVCWNKIRDSAHV